jgi:hypothetical protein
MYRVLQSDFSLLIINPTLAIARKQKNIFERYHKCSKANSAGLLFITDLLG